MGPAPLGVTLAIFADQDAEAYARFAIALVAQVMKADYLSLPGGLRLDRYGGCADHDTPRRRDFGERVACAAS
jgi:hypothetical protein